MSNAQSGASYEAELVDKISAPAAAIIHTLQQLDAAFKGIQQSSAGFASNMQVIAAAMRTAARGPNDQALGIGMVFNRVSEMSSQLGSSVGRALEGIGRSMQAVGFAAIAMSGLIVAAFSSIITSASNATETLSAFNVVIDSKTNRGKDAIKWADDFSKTLGRSSIEIKKSMTTYQSFWKGLGAAGPEANKLTKTMVQLQTDFSSFFNTTDEEGLRRFIAALSGSAEVLDQFGINIRENALEAKALTMGFGGNVRKLTEYQKALTRAAILLDVLGKRIGALGDAARTQFEWANSVRTFSAAIEDLKITLGQLIIPRLLPYLRAIVATFNDLTTKIKELTSGQIDQIVAGIATLALSGAGLVALGTALATVGSAITVAAIGMAGILTTIGALVAGGPIAAAVIGVLALGTAFAALTAYTAITEFPIATAFQILKERAENAVKSVSIGMNVIRKAIAGGDYKNAWEGFKLTAEVVFHEIALSLVNILGMAIIQTVQALDKAMKAPQQYVGEAIIGLFADGRSVQEPTWVDKLNSGLDAAKRKLRDLNKAIPDQPAVTENKKGIADSLINVAGFADVITGEQAWKRIADAGKALQAGFEAAKKNAEDIKKTAIDWADKFASPLEKFLDELRQIKLFESMNVGGRVNPDMVQRAMREAAKKFDATVPKPVFGSFGSFSGAVAKNIQSFAPPLDPMVDLTKTSIKIQQHIDMGIQKLITSGAIMK